jgi:CDGSH-type Zn-finger protein/ferredoxin
MSDEKPKISCLPNGPYYLFNDMTPRVIPSVESSAGEPRATAVGVALCRCGGSANKPFCDGTHGTNNFNDAKKDNRQPDKRENYVGRAITIHDNRGTCAHSGACTDNLASVFKLKQEPWINPDGASVQQIIDTIRKCPSGALSYTVDNVEYKGEERPPKVTVTKNGPYAVTGGIELLGQPKGEGASEEHFTLCRCGGSRNKPFCDGSHWYNKFRDDKN